MHQLHQLGDFNMSAVTLSMPKKLWDLLNKYADEYGWDTLVELLQQRRVTVHDVKGERLEAARTRAKHGREWVKEKSRWK